MLLTWRRKVSAADQTRLLLHPTDLSVHQVSPPPTDNVKRLRVIIETDAGDDQDDEQSLVRCLVHGKSSAYLKYQWKRKIILFTLRATKD